MRGNCLGGTACTGEQLDCFKQFSRQLCSFEFFLKHLIFNTNITSAKTLLAWTHRFPSFVETPPPA